MQKNINRMWLFHIIIFCVPLLSVWFAISDPRDVKAQSTPLGTLTPTATPTPVPTSQSSWRPQGVRRIPIRLQDTALLGLGGAGPGELSGGCDDLILPNDAPEIWRMSSPIISVISYPDSESNHLDMMGDLSTLSLTVPFSVWSCGGGHDPSTQVRLIWPTGQVEVLQRDSTMLGESNYNYPYIFSAAQPPGDYIVEIQNRYGVFSRQVTLEQSDYVKDHYYGPRFVLYDSVTGQDENKFRPGASMQIDYSKYSAGASVEVGIYQLVEMSGYNLINSWVFQADSEGQHSDIVPIPIDTLIGDYVVVASSLASVSRDNLTLNFLRPDFVGDFFAGDTVDQFYHLSFQVIDQVSTGQGDESQSNGGAIPIIVAPVKALDPAKVTASFYEALNAGASTGDFHAAYNYLSSNRKASRSYEALKAIYADTRQVQIESIEPIEENESNARVHIIVRLTELVNGALQETRYDVTYQLVKEDGDWHLDQFKSTKL